MIDLILITMLIISLSKPDILLSKKIKARASNDQKQILIKNTRIIYAILILTFESLSISRYIDAPLVIMIVLIIEIVLMVKYTLPAIKENKTITKTILV